MQQELQFVLDMKRFISVLLAAVMIFSMCIPSFAAGYDEHPTIYVTGARVNHIYAADGSLLFPNDVDGGQVLKDALKPCLEKLAKAHPDLKIFVGNLDRQLNEKAYICPGLGDAGDRIFGTK